MSDEVNFSLRRRLMERQEIYEWQKHEGEMKKLQEKKLDLLKNMLVEREKNVAVSNFRRVEHLKDILNSQKNRLVAKLWARKRKAVRKLAKLAKEFDDLRQEPGFAEKYHNFSSSAYASLLREGFSLERFSERFRADPLSMTNYELYTQLVESIQSQYLNATIDPDELLKRTQQRLLKLDKFRLGQLKKA